MPNADDAARAGAASAASSPRILSNSSGSVMTRWRSCCQVDRGNVVSASVKLANPDVAEPDWLRLGLQRDVPERQLQRRAGRHQCLGAVFCWIELRMLVAQHLHAVDAVDHLGIAVYFDFDGHPFVH